MSFANFGIGVGAFADGMRNGLDMGRTLKKVRQEKEIEQIREGGISDAQRARNANIDSQIKTVPAQGGIGPISYQVGDQSYSSRDEARRAASANAPDPIDIFIRDNVPKLQEAYIKQGNLEMAEYWRQFSEDRRGKDYMKNWTKAFMLGQAGDFDQSAKTMGGLLNSLDLGVTYQGHEVTKDGDGNATGFTMKVKNDETGKVTEMPMTLESYMEFVQMNNPQAFAESMYNQQMEANRARLEDAKAERKYNREQSGRIEIETLRSQLRDAVEQRKFDRNINALRQAGYSEEFINRALPSLLGVNSEGPYRKSASPEETARMLLQERMKDRQFTRKTPEEQQEIIRRDMQNILDAAAPFMRAQPQASAPSAPAGQQASPAGQAATQGVPVLDPKTGNIIYR